MFRVGREVEELWDGKINVDRKFDAEFYAAQGVGVFTTKYQVAMRR